MESIGLLENYPLIQMVLIVFSVIIGGVGYKYAALWLGHTDKNQNRTNEQAQRLFANMQERLDSMTLRLTQLEAQKDDAHERELQMTIQLTEAKGEVKLLMSKVDSLEKHHKTYKELVEHYKKMLEKYEQAA